jgi:uncharacterized membrane protein YfcA
LRILAIRQPQSAIQEAPVTGRTVLSFTLLVCVGSLIAGFLGSLTGLGGGVVIVPLLVIGFGVDIHYAAGASLVSVIATSSGAAAAYVKEGYTNIRIGMFLEVATTIGAIAGAWLALVVTGSAISVVFGVVLMLSVALSTRGHGEEPIATGPPDPLASRLRLDGTFPTPAGPQAYHVHRVPLGFGIMLLAGALSGLLGIGSGAFKVLAMDRAMGLPFKVSTTTSNFMIGVTAAASAGIYLSRGWIDPGLGLPVVLGALIGSMLGARLLPRLPAKQLRLIFALVILVLAVEMIYRGLTGRL